MWCLWITVHNPNRSPCYSSQGRLDSSHKGQPTGSLRSGTCIGVCPTAEAKKPHESLGTTSGFVAVKMLSAAKSNAEGIRPGGNTEVGF